MMNEISRIFNLTKTGKLTFVAFSVSLISLYSFCLYYLFSKDAPKEVIAAAISPVSVIIPIAVLSIILLFTEKKEDPRFLIGIINDFLQYLVPVSVNGRSVGEPFISCGKTAEDLSCKVFHIKDAPHAGYEISLDEYRLRFTILANVSRVSIIFCIKYNQEILSFDEQLAEKNIGNFVNEVCDQLISSGFRTSFQLISGNMESNSKKYAVILNNFFLENNKETLLSYRERLGIAREVAEFCRTIIRFQSGNIKPKIIEIDNDYFDGNP